MDLTSEQNELVRIALKGLEDHREKLLASDIEPGNRAEYSREIEVAKALRIALQHEMLKAR